MAYSDSPSCESCVRSGQCPKHPMRWEGARQWDPNGTGYYSVNPSKIRALSPEGRAWFKATLENVRESDRRMKQRTTLKTIAELNPLVAERERRIRQWATGRKRAA